MSTASPRFPAVAALSVCLLASAQAQVRVEITGGNDGSGQNYEWTVVNRHSAAITSIEFPHYQVDTFITPTGWKQECTNLAVAGSLNEEGVCRGYVEPPEQGIAPGASAKFGVRLARIGALKGSGTVTVTFADGVQAKVDGVTLPQAEMLWQKFLVPGAMGLIFVVAFLIHAARKRKKDAEPLEPT